MTLIDELEFKPSIPELMHQNARRWGEKDFIVTDIDRLSYAGAERASRGLAKRLLMAGAGKGTRIAAQFPYGTAWVVSWLAAARIGAIYIPFSSAYKPPELCKAICHADVALLLSPRMMFAEDRQPYLEAALPGLVQAGQGRLLLPDAPYLRAVWLAGQSDRAWAQTFSIDETPATEDTVDILLEQIESEVTPADLAVAIYTSGTTATPKGILHTHGALVRQGVKLAALGECGPEDRTFCGMPLFWIGGLAYTLLPVMIAGGTMLCVDKTEPGRCLELMEREQATRINAWPGVVGPIMNHPSAAGRRIPALVRANDPQPSGSPLGGSQHSSLGMTETLASHTYAGPEDIDLPIPEGLSGSMGPAVPGMEHRIADPESGRVLGDDEEGAILVRGPSLMAGMIKREREEVFTADGWYNTGDKGFLHGRLLFLSGRLSEMIKTAGNNVAPAEVEAILLSLPEIKEAYVLGIPDAERGEIVAAALVATPGASIDSESIRERVREQLSNYKVPGKIVVLSEQQIPWLASGKVDRLGIRRILAE